MSTKPGADPFNINSEGRFGELVGNVEELQCPTITGLIELKIKRPHVIRAHGHMAFTWLGGVTDPPTFTLFPLHP